MTLAEYLRTLTRDERAAFASKVSRAGSVGYLYLVAGGHRRPSTDLTLKIELHSCGAVSRAELRPDIFGAGLGVEEGRSEAEAA